MSQKVEQTLQKTANALANFNPGGVGPSKSFQLLVRAVGEAKTKHEEDRIMRKESIILKEKMAARDITPVCYTHPIYYVHSPIHVCCI